MLEQARERDVSPLGAQTLEPPSAHAAADLGILGVLGGRVMTLVWFLWGELTGKRRKFFS